MSRSHHCPPGFYNNFASQQNSSNCSVARLLPARGKARKLDRWKRPEAMAVVAGSRTRESVTYRLQATPSFQPSGTLQLPPLWWNDEIVLSAATIRAFRSSPSSTTPHPVLYLRPFPRDFHPHGGYLHLRTSFRELFSGFHAGSDNVILGLVSFLLATGRGNFVLGNCWNVPFLFVLNIIICLFTILLYIRQCHR